MRGHRRGHGLMGALAVLTALAAVTACSPGPGDQEPTAAAAPRATPDEPAPAEPSGTPAGESRPAPPVPGGHVHGLAIDPADGMVLVATHEGLVRYGEDGPTQLGPVVDLMGFAPGPDGLYASGHPGPGVELPEPVGLIRSVDGGRTWTVLSRGGESDFHALTASTAGVLGFDGRALWASTDGEQWERRDVPVPPYALAAAPDGSVVLATTTEGPLRSDDGGRTWVPLDQAPLLQFVAWAGGTVVGVTPEGAVAVSDDGGSTWADAGTIGGPPEGLAAATGAGGVRVVAVTGGRLVESRDGGASFAPASLP